MKLWIILKQIDVIDNIDNESIDVYKFLQSEFNKCDVTTNYLFQFVYRSFYRLDGAGLTDEFKVEYFRIMQEKRYSNMINLEDIVRRLYNFKRRKGDNSVQFSFTTKLMNTNEPSPRQDRGVSGGNISLRSLL